MDTIDQFSAELRKWWSFAGFPVERRKALALDIQAAIIRHAEVIAAEAIREALERTRRQ